MWFVCRLVEPCTDKGMEMGYKQDRSNCFLWDAAELSGVNIRLEVVAFFQNYSSIM